MVKRNILIQAALLSAFGLGALTARDIRTPLNLQNEPLGHFHIPIEWEEDEKSIPCWDFDVWGAGYAQNAADAFGPCDNHRVPITQLLFGLSDFTVSEVFANNTVSTVSPSTIFLSFSTVKPRVEYNEEGIVVGLNVARRFLDDRMHVGLRVNLPFRVVEMHRRNCDCGLGEEGLAEVRRCSSDFYDTYPTDPLGNSFGSGTLKQYECTYRLDFLDALAESNGLLPGITWGTAILNQAFQPGPIDVTDAGHVPLGVSDFYTGGNGMIAVPAHLLQETPGIPPVDRFAAGEFQVGVNGVPGAPGAFAYPVLDGAGAAVGGVPGSRWVFGQGVDYTVLSDSNAAKSKFWFVPTFYSDAAGDIGPSSEWITAESEIESLINTAGTFVTPSEFLANNGITFDTEKERGVGNLDTTIYLGYDFLCDKNMYGEGRFGVRWPTDKRDKNPGEVYRMATGNDGHYEVRVGTQWYYMPVCWFGMNFEGDYFHVCKRREKVAASFVGATIKNINPTVDAEVQWDYGLVKFDLNFYHPNNPGLGFLVGYEFYGKSKDRIEFVNPEIENASCGQKSNVCSNSNESVRTMAPDLFGNLQTLDPRVLERQTQRLSHKMRLEFFHHWNSGDLFLGWTHVVGGKEVMRETSWHIGMVVQY